MGGGGGERKTEETKERGEGEKKLRMECHRKKGRRKGVGALMRLPHQCGRRTPGQDSAAVTVRAGFGPLNFIRVCGPTWALPRRSHWRRGGGGCSHGGPTAHVVLLLPVMMMMTVMPASDTPGLRPSGSPQTHPDHGEPPDLLSMQSRVTVEWPTSSV